MSRRVPYERRGVLAIDPVAFLELHLALDREPAEDLATCAGVAIIDVSGPLESERAPRWCGGDSYPAILERVLRACAAPDVHTILMRYASPGGEVAGCFDTAREIRAACAAAGKPLYAYVTDRACSAAYALACAASKIFLSDAGIVGSIGVLSTREDLSERYARDGVRVAFTASGASKLDGHPASPVTDAELARTQHLVDSLAQVFFDLVSEWRGIDPQPLNASVFHGAEAIAKGLADQVIPLSSLLKQLTDRSLTIMAAEETPTEKARKMLQAIAEGDDAPAAASAKRALAALDGDEDDKPDPGAEDDKPAPDAEDDKPAPDAEDDKPAPSAEDDEDTKPGAKAKAKTAAARAYDLAAKAYKEIHKLKLDARTRDERDERARLIASRPDFSADYVAVLNRAPLATVRDLVKTTPRVVAQGADAASALASTRAPLTRGDDQGTDASPVGHLPPAERSALDARMGLTAHEHTSQSTPFKLTLGARVPVASTAPAAPVASKGVSRG